MYQRMMNRIFEEKIGDMFDVYMDDIVKSSKENQYAT